MSLTPCAYFRKWMMTYGCYMAKEQDIGLSKLAQEHCQFKKQACLFLCIAVDLWSLRSKPSENYADCATTFNKQWSSHLYDLIIVLKASSWPAAKWLHSPYPFKTPASSSSEFALARYWSHCWFLGQSYLARTLTIGYIPFSSNMQYILILSTFSVGKTKKKNHQRHHKINPDETNRAWDTDNSAAEL